MMSSTSGDNDNASSEVAREVGSLGEVTRMGLTKERAPAGGLLEPRPPPGAVFPQLKLGQGEV